MDYPNAFFDKILLLLVNQNITELFKKYINTLAYKLVKSQSDVIVFIIDFGKDKHQNLLINLDFEYVDNYCCLFLFPYYSASNAIYTKINIPVNFNFNPEFFITYTEKQIGNNDNINNTNELF